MAKIKPLETIIENQHENIVVAIKDGVVKHFPRAAWNNLGSDKGGYVLKVETPKEVKGDQTNGEE